MEQNAVGVPVGIQWGLKRLIVSLLQMCGRYVCGVCQLLNMTHDRFAALLRLRRSWCGPLTSVGVGR